MFVFLGLPGVVLAAILTAYAGGVLADAMRREQAILRIRGANRGHLLRMHAVRTLALATVGSLLGVALGLASRARRCYPPMLGQRLRGKPAASALLGAGCGFLATSVALYAAGQRAISHQISDERCTTASQPPLWRILKLDFLILMTVAAVEWYQRRHGGFEGVRDRSITAAPCPCACTWSSSRSDLLGAVLVLGRVVERVFAHLPPPRNHRFGRPFEAC